jgi:hypothetical protein
MKLTKISIVLCCVMAAAACGDRQQPGSPKPPAPQVKPEPAPAPAPAPTAPGGTADKPTDQKKP